ncbi:unnamed protein product [Darwinula stevensoni]|uniref:Elongation of very long chain fatty acids protein n=1 Tax=Darwinula stevensoni TaxID=69355 RepID=A0A7R8XAW0_9CRUS|nr:unnamed protein product [Darwinula stevensoni]CAG0885956.1 unnamed protein product [Darwinula stevensoni]
MYLGRRQEEDPIGCYWVWLFTLSKILEFGDTYFILLRKQKLIFLHWYHHATVLLFTWFNTSRSETPGVWFCAMNAAVHTIMYTYYALRALKLPVPRGIMMSITITQILQMVLGLTLCFLVVVRQWLGHPCTFSRAVFRAALLMYLSYFLLFLQFFLRTYKPKPKPVEAEKKPPEKVNGLWKHKTT